jgi:hypothetical protein
MDFSRFFIDRPIFAAVLSILIFITGLIAIPLLPVSEYPDVVPPSVQVRAEYPGANPKVIAETVATPLEEAINGVENMMYMKSVAAPTAYWLPPSPSARAPTPIRRRFRYKTGYRRPKRVCRKMYAVWGSLPRNSRRRSPWWCICFRPTVNTIRCICVTTPP